MAFLGTLWKILVGVKDALVLLLLLLFFAALWSALSLRTPSVRVPEGSALVLDLEGSLVDQATPISPVAGLVGDGIIRETEVDDVVRAIDLAAKDRSIKALVLDLDAFTGGGLANLAGVGRAIERFRAAKKPVFAYATAYGDDSWYLAAHASEAWVNPMGGVFLAGPGGKRLYLKGALDRLKVDVEVFRVGTFKSAVEPFTRSEASPEARAADQALADDLWASYRTGVAAARPRLDVAAALESMPARVSGLNADLATLAKDMGFVDRVGSKLEFTAKVREVVGEGKSDGRTDTVNGIGLADYLAARRGTPSASAPVGVVHVAGAIVDGEAREGQAGSETIANLIQEAIADDQVKAIVVRIDSPGGSATASEEIANAISAARAKGKPVVASMGPVAASGGYWVAMAAERVYADPATVTGSIGVFGLVPTFGRTLGSLGITTDGVATTPYSGQPDILGTLNDPARQLIQASVADVYRRFVELVATARKLPVAEVEQVAEGRVWSGVQALKLRLVDAHGGLDAAVAEAGRLAKIEGDVSYRFIRQPRPWFEELLRTSLAPAPAAADPYRTLAEGARSSLVSALSTLLATLDGATIQATCVSCGLYRPAQPETGTPERWQRLARFLD